MIDLVFQHMHNHSLRLDRKSEAVVIAGGTRRIGGLVVDAVPVASKEVIGVTIMHCVIVGTSQTSSELKFSYLF
jgi:hypothetical protein